MEKWEKVKCSFTGYDHSIVYKLHLEMLLDDVPGVWYNQANSVLISGSVFLLRSTGTHETKKHHISDKIYQIRADVQAIFHDAVKEIIMLLQAQIEDTNQTAGNASSDAYVSD